MSVASWCCTCFCVVLCVSFCTGHFVIVPLNLTYRSTLFTTFFLWTSLQFVLWICQLLQRYVWTTATMMTAVRRKWIFILMLCSHIFLVLRDHGVNMYVVYIWKWSSAHALGGVRGVESFITTDEQLQWNRGCCFLVQAMLPEGFPFHQFYIVKSFFKETRFCCGHKSSTGTVRRLLHQTSYDSTDHVRRPAGGRKNRTIKVHV